MIHDLIECSIYGTEKPPPTGFYPNIRQAMRAVRALRIKSAGQYRKKYKKDSRLPSHPNEYYQDKWAANGGWSGFFGKKKTVKNIYATYQEASRAAQRLGIRSCVQYELRYEEDPRLPSSPAFQYPNDWRPNGGWPGFLKTGRPAKNFYPIYQHARAAVKKLGIRTQREYRQRYKEDPRLPARPDEQYPQKWKAKGGWNGFLGKKKNKKYKHVQMAATAAQALGIRTGKQYREDYRQDPRLPSRPDKFYRKTWNKIGGWNGFLGKRPYQPYKQIARAMWTVKNLGIRTRDEYQVRYKEHPRLPSHPRQFYADKWPGWPKFLGHQTIH